MKTEKIKIDGPQGHKLAARFDAPDESAPAAIVLAAHCFTCTKDFPILHHLATALTARGIALMRFDFTGLGQSDGPFTDSGFLANIDDIKTMAAFLAARNQAPSILFGHSLGGTAMLVAANALPSVKIVATLGSPFEPRHALRLSESQQKELKQTGTTSIKISNNSYAIDRAFVEQADGHDMKSIIHGLKAHLIVFQDPEDQTVGVENARLIYEAAKHPKSFISLPHAGHLLPAQQDADYVASILTAAAERYALYASAPQLKDHS